jgi:hypothetical protein
VSCVSSVFCAAAGGSRVATFNGSAWSTPVLINSATIESISCPSSSFCVAVGLDGEITTFNGGEWSSPRVVDAQRTLDSVSCPTQSFCLAIDQSGYAVTLTEGAANTSVRKIASKSPGYVSCASSSLCVAVEGTAVLTFDGSSWSKPVEIDNPAVDGSLRSVSCPSVSFCVANDRAGNVMIAGVPATVTSVSPAIGPTTGGTVVTITGTGFENVSAVHFGGGEATIAAHSDTSITVVTPPGARSVYVTVTTPAGTSAASGKEAKRAKFKYKKVKT